VAAILSTPYNVDKFVFISQRFGMKLLQNYLDAVSKQVTAMHPKKSINDGNKRFGRLRVVLDLFDAPPDSIGEMRDLQRCNASHRR